MKGHDCHALPVRGGVADAALLRSTLADTLRTQADVEPTGQ